jgi:hypothetical protein
MKKGGDPEIILDRRVFNRNVEGFIALHWQICKINSKDTGQAYLLRLLTDLEPYFTTKALVKAQAGSATVHVL